MRDLETLNFPDVGHLIFLSLPSPPIPLPAPAPQQLSLDSVHLMGYQVPHQPCRCHRCHQTTHQTELMCADWEINDPMPPVPPHWGFDDIMPSLLTQGQHFCYDCQGWVCAVDRPGLISFIESHSLAPKPRNAPTLCIRTDQSVAVINLYTPSFLASFLPVTTYLLTWLYFFRDWFCLQWATKPFQCSLTSHSWCHIFTNTRQNHTIQVSQESHASHLFVDVHVT